MAPHRLFVVVFVAVLSLVTVVLWAERRDTLADEPNKVALKGLVYVEASEQLTFTLEGVEVGSVGDRAFLIGREVQKSPQGLTRNRFDGGTIWLPVDSIKVLVELPPATN